MRTITLATLILSAPMAAHADCLPLSPGHKVTGEARWSGDDQPLTCVELSAPVGTKVRVHVTAPDKDVAFSIPGEVDCQSDHSFTTKRPSYHIDVFHMFNHPPVAFTLEAVTK